MDRNSATFKKVKSSIMDVDLVEPVQLQKDNLWDPVSKSAVTVLYAEVPSSNMQEKRVKQQIKDSIESYDCSIADIRTIQQLENYENLIEIHLSE